MLKKMIMMMSVLAITATAFAGDGRIFGTVAGADGQPMSGAKVELLRDISPYRLVAFTTGTGEYAFNDVTPGMFLVRALAQGELVGELRVPFMRSGNKQVDIKAEAQR
ncbi:carboxypeptidase-like regulatory domain-containing protein [Pseudodesulfovibrio sediminis]|uniref:Carboxypeptidase regulatory-like domain-containing protein n=1 Tax=Pseudodesulfovibrio sediminis TaxID=2810563 RepID=A0ABN6EY19_9BACT|nr:carboxypeptidase-like regulatory domain-containing protein [Pseudodesulfovibrio sediminis]BCS90139.1 hypothetical protein PSDVSF_33810 [Pseudodesulfovibrio sediminis]